MGIGNALLNGLFPPNLVCPFCNKEALLTSDGICSSCKESIQLCPPWIAPPYGLDGLTAGLMYDGVTKQVVRRFKYGREVWLAPHLAKFVHIPPNWKIDCYVPVPLHPLREWMRTFNQSLLVAQSLQKRFPFPIRKDLLRRIRYTSPQAKLDASHRATNLSGAFRAVPAVSGLSILLIDDVTTTHNTLMECALALRTMGAKRIYAACVCMAGSDQPF